MKQESNSGISFFQRYLTVWVFLCMVAGVLLGHFAPGFPNCWLVLNMPVFLFRWLF